MSDWVPVQCPNCGYEDQADSKMLDEGHEVECAVCGNNMEKMPG